MAREDVLRAIKDAEIAATATLLDAKKEAAQIVSQARQNASEILTSGKSTSESEAQNLISEARASAGTEAEVVSTDGHAAQKSVHDSGKKNRDKAAKLVIDSFRK
jgi:vacuolar-type H+-ATPase subunit H